MGSMTFTERFTMRSQMFHLLAARLLRQFQQERRRFRSFAHTYLFFSELAKVET
jgi:hypothetical protein